MSLAKEGLIGLDKLQIGEAGIIRDYRGDSDVQLRLKELGLVRGAVVSIKRFAPLGDPMELIVRGYRLSIRKDDAGQILVIKTHALGDSANAGRVL